MDNQHREAAENAKGNSPQGAPPERAVRRIVVIEDQTDNRNMLVSLLELEEFEVFSASNGRKGLELIQRERPDAAIVDIGLPDIDGYEVARQLRRCDEPIRNIRLIALTGYGQAEDVEHALNAGFDCHLLKPFEPAALFRILHSRARSDRP